MQPYHADDKAAFGSLSTLFDDYRCKSDYSISGKEEQSFLRIICQIQAKSNGLSTYWIIATISID